jgi:hypothetical protein
VVVALQHEVVAVAETDGPVVTSGIVERAAHLLLHAPAVVGHGATEAIRAPDAGVEIVLKSLRCHQKEIRSSAG